MSTHTEPTTWDYVKSAFNHRCDIAGLGGVPVNWLYLALVGGISIVAWPFGLAGLGLEAVYLGSMAGNPRYQMIVRSQRIQETTALQETEIDQMAYNLPTELNRRYCDFRDWCREVESIARTVDGGIADSYRKNLMSLRSTYVQLATGIANIDKMEDDSQYSYSYGSRRNRTGEKEDLEGKIAAVQQAIDKLPEDAPYEQRASMEATIESLRTRQGMVKEKKDHLAVNLAELQRLDEQVKLMRDQVLVGSRDTSSLTANLEATCAVIDSHAEWLKMRRDFSLNS